MKDEEMAEEYTDSIEEKKHWSDENDSNAVFTRQDVEQAFLAGLKAERQNNQLTKAIEIIKILADDLSMYSGNYQKELLEAEQFLKANELKSDIFPEITLPEGSAEFVDKAIADAEKHLKKSE